MSTNDEKNMALKVMNSILGKKKEGGVSGKEKREKKLEERHE